MGYSITELKKGTIFQMEGIPYIVTEYSQKVMGRGGSIVNVRIKNLLNGSVLQKTFKGSETLEAADVSSQNVQYLYNDGSIYYFMNQESFEQFELAAEMIEGNAGYLKEGDTVQVQLFEGRVINIVMPKNVYLKVDYAEDAVKGDTSSSIQKDATLETGIVVKVPAFIRVGDIISVDTETGAYRERKKD